MAVRQVLEDDGLRMSIAREALRRAIQEDADHTAERFGALYARLL
jgi:hypothetical protein